MTISEFLRGEMWMENDPEANIEPGAGSNSTPERQANRKQDNRKQRRQMFRTDNSTRATQGRMGPERRKSTCKHILSLLIIAAVMLVVTPGAQAGIYIELMDSLTDLEMDYIPTNTPVAIRVMMDNDAGDNATGLTNGIRIYSPNDAIWQAPTYTVGDSLSEYFDLVVMMYGYSVDGVSDDTIGVGAAVMVLPGVPDGYEGLELFRVNTMVSDTYRGDTLCIDSCFYPPGGIWVWNTPSGTTTPSWGGPYCFAIAPHASISGTKFHDENGNSFWDGGEGPLDNVTINLHGALDAGGTVDLSTVTDAQGEYFFSGLTPGDYWVVEDVESWWAAQTYPLTVFHTVPDVQWGDNVTGLNFGNDTLCEQSTTYTTCLHGTEDNFAGAEPSNVSPSLLAWLQSQYDYITDFDQPADNQAFGHTFEGCWDDECEVIAATLRIKLRGSASGAGTDFLILGDYNQPNNGRIWSITISDLDAHFGGDGVWNVGEVGEFTLDLANLPYRSWLPTNILAALQDGSLDIVVSDDTECDYIELTVETCCWSPPSPGGVYVELSDSATGDIYDYVPAGTPVIIKVKMHNDIGQNVTGLSNGIRLYSPTGATWQAPSYVIGDSMGDYFDMYTSVNGYSVDGSGADTIGVSALAFGSPGVPDGYEGLELFRLSTQLSPSSQGDTLCIDSSFYQPSGVWQWAINTGGVAPSWGGPYCWAIIESNDTCYANGDVNNDGLALTVQDMTDLIAYLNGSGSVPPAPYKADLNGDGVIDGGDVQVYKSYFIYGLSAFAPYGGYPVACPCDPVLAPASMYLHSVTGGGAYGPGAVVADEPIIFEIGLRNFTGPDILTIAHGFRVYSPNGAEWLPLVYDTAGGLDTYFDDVVSSSGFSVTGSGADTVALYASAASPDGSLNGYDDVVLRVGTMVSSANRGDTICIDSSFYPPGGPWQWIAPSFTITPMWDGPHCFEIIEVPWDTLDVFGGTLVSLGRGAIDENLDSSVTLSNLGSSGEDGAIFYGDGGGSGGGGGGGGVEFDSIMAGPMDWGDVAWVWGDDGPPAGCCKKMGGYPPSQNCATVAAGEACPYPTWTRQIGRVCSPIWYPNWWNCEWPTPIDPTDVIGDDKSGFDFLVTSDIGDGTIVIGPHVGNGETEFILDIYNDGSLVDSVVCDTGTVISTTKVLPVEVTVGNEMSAKWMSDGPITIGGDTYVGDEVRVRMTGGLPYEGEVNTIVVRASGIPELTITDMWIASCCVGIRGNVNNDTGDNVDISDLVYLVDYMFTGGPPPPCMEEADINGDGGVDIADLVHLVDYMFTGGPPPVSCGSKVKAGKAITQSSEIIFDLEYVNGTSTVVMNSAIDLRGIQLELKGVGPAPANLVGEHIDIVQGRDGWVVKVGLLDLNGGEIISADTREIVRFEGEYTLESVTVADLNARSITPTIGSVHKNSGLPSDYALSQNYPNPFNPSTSISFALPDASEVRLDVFDILGRRVSTIVNQPMEAGHHTAEWNGQNKNGQAVSSGVYFYRLETPQFTQSKKMVLLK